jgi:hypothetical protein
MMARCSQKGRLPKERLVKKKQLQSESAVAATAASSFFFFSSSSNFSLVCIYNLLFFFLGYYGFPCIVKESVSVLVLRRIR